MNKDKKPKDSENNRSSNSKKPPLIHFPEPPQHMFSDILNNILYLRMRGHIPQDQY
jgi:hypothetical protein